MGENKNIESETEKNWKNHRNIHFYLIVTIFFFSFSWIGFEFNAFSYILSSCVCFGIRNGFWLFFSVFCFVVFFLCVRQGNEVYDWSQEQQGIILSSFYWGYVITQIPGALLSQRFGGKPVFFWSILLSAFCTIVTPTVITASKSLR